MFRVSRLLAHGGLCDPSWFTPEGRDRGHVVHLAAEGVFTGQPVDVAPRYVGYVEALRKGYSTLAFTPIWVERRLSDCEKTGRPDAVGYLTQRTGTLWPGPAIIDVKSGDREPQHGVQLAFYADLADACGARALLPPEFWNLPWQRVGFYVRPNGTYTIHPYLDPADRDIAHAILDLTRWRAAHGLLPASTNDDDLTEELAHGLTADGPGDGAGSRQPNDAALPAGGA